MITFGSKLNRSYSLYVPFDGDNIDVTVFFSKSNTYLGFVTDQRTLQKKRDGEVITNIYKELDQSSFANTFLDIKTFKSYNLDVKCQFNNILAEYRDKIEYVFNETIKISQVRTTNGVFDSCLFIYAFKFADYGDDFLFFIAERQHIDTILAKKLVRTCGFQICTEETKDILDQMVTNINSGGVAVDINHVNLLKDIVEDETANTKIGEQ